MAVRRRGFSFILALCTVLPLSVGCSAHGPQSINPVLVNQPQWNGNVRILSGEQEIPVDLVVPKGSVLIISPGTQLRIGPNVKIHVDGRLIAQGTKERPIVFSAANAGTYWRGIKLKGSERPPELDPYWRWLTQGDAQAEAAFFDKIRNGNWFEHCVFKNLATPKIQWERANKWRGAIEAYETALRVKDCAFEDVLYFGAVLSQRSYIVVDGNQFDSKTLHKAVNATDRVVGVVFKNTVRGHRTENFRCADGIWVKTFVGLIASNLIETVADDGLDLDRSRTVVLDNRIIGAHDDGIDVSNEGLAYVVHNRISGISENGILVSNGSRALLEDVQITKSPAGLTVRDGGWAQGRKLDISENKTGVLLFQQVPCALTVADYQRVKSQIQAMPLEEIRKQQELRVVRKAKGDASSSEVGEVLDQNYTLKGDRYVLSAAKPESLGELDDLRKVFKLVEIFDADYVTSAETQADPLCQALTTHLSLADSAVTANQRDVAVYHGYEMEIASTRFSSPETARGVESMVKPLSQSSHFEPNTSTLESNSRRIVQALEILGVVMPKF